MNTYSIRLLLAVCIAGVTGIAFPTTSYALSCWPQEEWLNAVGDNQTLIFTGTVTQTSNSETATQETVTVTHAYQGTIPSHVTVSHKKDKTWGYMCNVGPQGNQTTNLYLVTKDDSGAYQVNQTAASASDFANLMVAKVATKNVTGTITPTSIKPPVTSTPTSSTTIHATTTRTSTTTVTTTTTTPTTTSPTEAIKSSLLTTIINLLQQLFGLLKNR